MIAIAIAIGIEIDSDPDSDIDLDFVHLTNKRMSEPLWWAVPTLRGGCVAMGFGESIAISERAFLPQIVLLILK
jgi:hypothetical protein